MSDHETTVINYSASPDRESIEKMIVTSAHPQVLLVIPTRPSRAINLLHLRLLQRLAISHQKIIAIATRSITVTELAKSAHIPVFRSVGKAKRKPWQAQHWENDAILAAWLPDQHHNPPRPEKKRWFFPTLQDRSWVEWSAVLMALLLLALLPTYLFSSAEIDLHLAPTLHSMTFLLNGRTTVLSADISGNFPVHEEYQILEIDGQAESTGFLSLPEDFATGTIQVSNLSDETIEVPAGLIVMTLDTPPIQFSTTEDIQMEAGSDDILIPIQALEPGKASNVAAEAIQAVAGESGAVLRVINLQPTIGGANRRVNTPTETDVNKLREALLLQLQTQAAQQFEERLAESQTLVPENIVIDEIITEEIVPTPGETAEIFNLSLRVRFQALYVDTADLIRPAKQLLAASLPENQTLIEDTLEIIPVSKPQFKDDIVSWEVFVHQKSQPLLNNQNLRSFAGGTKIALNQWLNDTYSLTQPVKITTKPINAFWLPPLSERMELTITQ